MNTIVMGRYEASDFGSDFSEEREAREGKSDSVRAGFREENVWGEGATCRVYKLRLNGLQVAVKRLKHEFLTDPVALAAYRKEFQIGQSLKHDALPIYRDWHADSQEVYIIMDFVDGITLADFLETEEGKGYFRDFRNVNRFLKDLLNVTAYLHRSGVIHCDLKPANIMLRHSDRGLMLIDLDKSYSDTRNRSHGGTVAISDPIEGDASPTASKDFQAIGKILDAITSSVEGFPKARFRNFRNECNQSSTTYTRLTEELDKRARVNGGWIIGAAALMIGLVVGILFLKSSNSSEQSTISEQDLPREMPLSADSTIISSPIPKQTVAPPPSVSTNISATSKDLQIDMETPMEELVTKVEEASKKLAAGITRKELLQLQYSVMDAQTAAYQKVLDQSKKFYPDLAAVDVELAVARAFEKSRAGRLYIQYNQTVRDTLQKWDASDNDFQ